MATTEAPAAPPNGSAWLPISEAAVRLGVSQDAVRRRLKAGQMQGRREAMPQGFRWLVLLDGASDEEDAQGGATHNLGGAPPNDSPQGGAQVAELATVRAQEMAAYTEALLGPWRRLTAEQAERIGRLEERLAAAEARLAEVDPVRQQRAPSPGWEARRWWQRLLWG